MTKEIAFWLLVFSGSGMGLYALYFAAKYVIWRFMCKLTDALGDNK